jgi:hypothetical protein
MHEHAGAALTVELEETKKRASEERSALEGARGHDAKEDSKAVEAVRRQLQESERRYKLQLEQMRASEGHHQTLVLSACLHAHHSHVHLRSCAALYSPESLE